jgi:hypothetical protein
VHLTVQYIIQLAKSRGVNTINIIRDRPDRWARAHSQLLLGYWPLRAAASTPHMGQPVSDALDSLLGASWSESRVCLEGDTDLRFETASSCLCPFMQG